MSIFFNKDNSFFKVESPDLDQEKSITKLANEEIVSLNVTEEIGSGFTGNLLMHDPNHYWSRVLRNGMELDIEFGYKKFTENIGGISGLDIDEQIRSGERTGLKAFIASPSGGGSENGVITYNLSFYSQHVFVQGKDNRVFDSNTRKDVIIELFNNLGISKPIIDFDTENTRLDTDSAITQWQTSFNMLFKLSFEWRSIFHTGFNGSGKAIGVFVDATKLADLREKGFFKDIFGLKGGVRTFFYNDAGRSNIKSYGWKHNVGESGQGDNVNLTLVNGKFITKRIDAKTQKVVTYELNMQKVKDQFKDKPLTEYTSTVIEAFKKKDFEEVKFAFDEIESSTAPQGMGFEIEIQAQGDPLIAPPMEAKFEGNWPSILMQSKDQLGALTKFFVRKINHSFSKSQGYNTAISIADSYTINGSAIAPDTGLQ